MKTGAEHSSDTVVPHSGSYNLEQIDLMFFLTSSTFSTRRVMWEIFNCYYFLIDLNTLHGKSNERR
jgi:hypothetical protein